MTLDNKSKNINAQSFSTFERGVSANHNIGNLLYLEYYVRK